MKTMLLKGGDLDLASSGGYRMVQGPAKVAQDLRGALLESLGDDRFHPGWGSVLEDSIAGTVNDLTRLQVTSEINRVVGNYASVQRDRVERDLFSDSVAAYAAEEIVSRITEIDVVPSLDSLRVTIGIGTATGDIVSLDEVI